ncbi:MAG: lipase secretion chaperone [Ramlibacter sp.]
MSTGRHALVLALAAGIAGLGAWWLWPAPQGAAVAQAGATTRGPAPSEVPPSASAATAATLAGNGLAAATEDPFFTNDLRYRLEAALIDAGDADSPAVLKQKLQAVLPRHFSASDLARAMALMERYVDYRVALGAIKPPRDPGDPRALRLALGARDRARHQYFSEEEHRALFAQEEALDRFTLARLEIERNPDLSPAQKQAALQDTLSELTPAQRQERVEAVQQMAVAAQTAALDARGASEAERYRLRQTQYGDAAALNLAQLDRENADWQVRLSQYAEAQARQASAAQLGALRQTLFSEQEQLRLEAALSLRQQNAAPTPIR